MIKACDLIKKQKEIDEKKYVTFKKIYTIVEKKIVIASSGNNYSIIFEIPTFLVGVSIYSVDECKTYLCHQLKKNGFKIDFFEPNILIISWFPIEDENKTKL